MKTNIDTPNSGPDIAPEVLADYLRQKRDALKCGLCGVTEDDPRQCRTDHIRVARLWNGVFCAGYYRPQWVSEDERFTLKAVNGGDGEVAVCNNREKCRRRQEEKVARQTGKPLQDSEKLSDRSKSETHPATGANSSQEVPGPAGEPRRGVDEPCPACGSWRVRGDFDPEIGFSHQCQDCQHYYTSALDSERNNAQRPAEDDDV